MSTSFLHFRAGVKYRRSHKKSSHYRIAFPQKSLPGRQFTRKNPSRPGGRRAGRIFAGKLSTGERLFRREEGRFYNRTPIGDVQFPQLAERATKKDKNGRHGMFGLGWVLIRPRHLDVMYDR